MKKLTIVLAALAASAAELPRDTGYRGIWYYNQPIKGSPYVYKYSGGFATYPQQQSPIAIYSEKAQKTFFVFGGTVEGKQELLHLVSYYDHKTGMVPRPRILVNKKTEDAHDNPVMSIDDDGYIWIFSNAHGTSRPAYISRSDKPYSVDGFTQIRTTNFSYGHPWFVPGQGFFFLHTIYLESTDM
jgi:predicted neuraminidase